MFVIQKEWLLAPHSYFTLSARNTEREEHTKWYVNKNTKNDGRTDRETADRTKQWNARRCQDQQMSKPREVSMQGLKPREDQNDSVSLTT